MLAIHFAAMFAPALGLSLSPGLRSHASAVCAGLLGLGALASLGGASAAWWVVTLTQGAAWSIAWSVRSGQPAAGSPLAAGGVNASLCVGVGLAMSAAGLAGLAGWHLLIGGAAVAGWTASVAPDRSAAVRRTQRPAPAST